jgi:hypothetical protein
VPELKAVLFEAYRGFADKRVKNLDKASTFLVDDRDPGVIGADKKPLSWFCQIYAHAVEDDELLVRLTNRKQGRLDELAALTKVIVAPRAPHYEWKHYKYACPRAARSLEKLRKFLDKAWPPGSKSTKPKPALSSKPPHSPHPARREDGAVLEGDNLSS